MSRLLEDYGRLFKRHLSGDCRIDPFFLDSALLPGPKSEIRRRLLARLCEQSVEARQTAAPIICFLAHFIDEYQEIERQIPGFFDEVNARVRDEPNDADGLLALLETALGEGGGSAGQAALAYALTLGVVLNAYTSARQVLNRDLEELGVRRVQ